MSGLTRASATARPSRDGAPGQPARARRLLAQPGGVTGLALMLVVLIVAVGADWLAPYPPKVSVAAPLLPPSMLHCFGTDDLGRDLFSQVVYGARVTLVVGLGTAAIAAVIGTLVGLLAGYLGGLVDDGLMQLTDTFQLLPRFFLALLLVTVFGSNVGWLALMLGATFWPSVARVLRAQVLSLRQREYVQAAQAIGMPDGRIRGRHVLPGALAPVIITLARQIAGAMQTEAGLSFLGLGDPTLVSWGMLLNNAQQFIRIAWWLYLFPGAALVLTVLSTTLLADACVTALQPQEARR